MLAFILISACCIIVRVNSQNVPLRLPIIGPYKLNLYFGLGGRTPQALTVGLMWGASNSWPSDVNHTCEQDDGVLGWGWQHHDPRVGGVQHLPDDKFGWNLTTASATSITNDAIEDTILRVTAVPRYGSQERLRLVLYASMETSDSSNPTFLQCRSSPTWKLDESRPFRTCQGRINGTQAVRIGFYAPQDLDRMSSNHLNAGFSIANATSERLWRPLDVYQDELASGRLSHDELRDSGVGNMVSAQFASANVMDIVVKIHLEPSSKAHGEDEATPEAIRIEDMGGEFSHRYEKVFAPALSLNDVDHHQFGEQTLSNLLGGLGYFHGDVKVNRSSITRTESPYDLLTTVSSRPFFPRGFLRDEGFHQLVVHKWDVDLTLEVLDSWYHLMDSDGWIARELILGDEARSKVPGKFQVQRSDIANPPTFFLVVEEMLEVASGFKPYMGHPSSFVDDQISARRRLAKLYLLLSRQYSWFRKSQAGKASTNAIQGYRWRGRTDQYTLPSGLDDYPRAVPATDSELHVDLLCWIGVMARTMEKLATFLNLDEDTQRYAREYDTAVESIDEIHWSEKSRVYCDIVRADGERTFVCEKGYISLFPFLTGLMNSTHPHLDAMLDLISDPAELWSPYGIRSLSPTSKFYGKDENYWRGPIWINMNYMILTQLLRHALVGGPHSLRARSLYVDLRRNLVDTVFRSWQRTSYVSEQYNQDTGQGQRTQHFTGWTALIVNIMSMPDLDEYDATLMPQEQLRSFSGTSSAVQRQSPWRSSELLLTSTTILVLAFLLRRRMANAWLALRIHRR